MMRGGYGCAGYYNADLNKDLRDTCVLLNARLCEFQGPYAGGSRMTIQDFNDFLEFIVIRQYRSESDDFNNASDADGTTVPWRESPSRRSLWFSRWPT